MNLNELTEAELGKLFPIELVPYNEDWPLVFIKEKSELKRLLGSTALRIVHIGSTAIPGMASKPTIDILVEIPPPTDELKSAIISKLKTINYDFIWRTDEQPPYMMFAKGYSLDGIIGQTCHVHMEEKNHPLWDRLYFRDYLRLKPDLAKAYEQLKMKLAGKHKNNREAYTMAKTDFIKSTTEQAKAFYTANS